MIPVIDFARAEALQRQTETQRQTHRDELKVVEVRDQSLKRLLKTGKAYQDAIDSAPADLLAELGLRAGDEENGEPVLVELPSPVTPALDYPESHPVEPRVAAIAPESAPAPKPAPRVVPLESTPSERSRPARPNAAGVRALADNVLAILESVRFGSTASIDLEVLYERTGKTKAAITAAIEDLAERGLIRKCRAAERGQLTVILKAVAA